MRVNLAFLTALILLFAVGCVTEEAEPVGTTTVSATSVTAIDPAPVQPAPTTATSATGTSAAAATDTATTATGEKKPVPKTHTVDHGGVMHAAGSDDPMQRCASCHGQDLRGGKVASSSCYDCHEAVWEG